MSIYSLLCLSDFTIDPLIAYLNESSEQPIIEPFNGPFNQVIPILMDAHHEIWNQKYDSVFLWTYTESICPEYVKVLEQDDSFDSDKLLNEVELFAEIIKTKAQSFDGNIFIADLHKRSFHSRFSMNDWKSTNGASYWLAKINLLLADSLSEISNIFFLNAQNWLQKEVLYHPKLWYMGKVPFSNTVFEATAKDLKFAMRTLLGQSKKLIVLDLDNTLWGGVLGEEGYENLRLGQSNHIGEAFVDFQLALKKLKSAGILLAICSKNDEEIALEAIEKHTEMVLKEEDFVTHRINWKDKSDNIISIAEELNIGLQSIVFIDDSPAEQDQVRKQLSEVMVPEWPKDPAYYCGALNELKIFDSTSISVEDRQKTDLYKIEQKRQEYKVNVTSKQEWIISLDVKFRTESLSKENKARAAQILNKTNQFNLTTRRMAENDLWVLSQNLNHRFWVVYIEDKFGNYGLCGLVGLEKKEEEILITDFLLSCRVLGRGVEDTLLNFAVEEGTKDHCKDLHFPFKATQKNNACRLFLETSKLKKGEDDSFFWDEGLCL